MAIVRVRYDREYEHQDTRSCMRQQTLCVEPLFTAAILNSSPLLTLRTMILGMTGSNASSQNVASSTIENRRHCLKIVLIISRGDTSRHVNRQRKLKKKVKYNSRTYFKLYFYNNTRT